MHTLPATPSQEAQVWIACAADDAYSMPLAVTLFAALRRMKHQTRVCVVIMDNGIQWGSQQKIAKIIEGAHPQTKIVWSAPPPDMMNGLIGHRHISVSSYLRLFIAELLPPEATRIIYIDSDILVLGDLEELYGQSLGDNIIGAIRDFSIPHISHSKSSVYDYEKLQIDGEYPYLNAGILLVNLERWRGDSIGQRTTAYAIEHAGNLRSADQDAINAVLWAQWKELDYHWNVQAPLITFEHLPPHPFTDELKKLRTEILRDSKIVHFTGGLKPWSFRATDSFSALWRQEMFKSGWFSLQERISWQISFHLKKFMRKAMVALGLKK